MLAHPNPNSNSNSNSNSRQSNSHTHTHTNTNTPGRAQTQTQTQTQTHTHTHTNTNTNTGTGIHTTRTDANTSSRSGKNAGGVVDVSPSTQLPLVMLLDLDGTLIGRVNLLICEYDLHREAARSRGAGASAAASAAGRALRESFTERLRHGILRPGVKRFVRRVEQMRAELAGSATPIELFVYTASEDAWARFIIPCVEAAIGARFNRPLFVRSHCLVRQGSTELRKSIASLMPRLLRALRPRYPLLLDQGSLADRIVLVDNTSGVLIDPNERARLLVCPTYDYQHVHDVLGRLPAGVLLTRPLLVATVLARHGVGRGPPWAAATAAELASSYYLWLSQAIARTARPNELAQRHDVFWEALRKNVLAIARRSPRATLPAQAVTALQRAGTSALPAQGPA